MGNSKTKATFFSKKSKVLNASIISKLRTYCAKKIDNLIGGSFSSRYEGDRDFACNPQAFQILSEMEEGVKAGVPKHSMSVYTAAFAWARRFDALSEKNLSVPLENVDPDNVALVKFRAAEASCKEWNRHSKEILASSPILGIGSTELIQLLQMKIASYLGECPGLSDIRCSFGPGANTTCRRRTTAKWKLSSQLACTRDSRSSLNELSALYPRLNWKSIKLDSGSLFCVPKKATASRMAMAEPILGTFVQRGIGGNMKRSLLKKGCNLYDQTLNREYARLGSLNGDIATVDLSSASDMISRDVVKALLPLNWFTLLSQWRTDLAYLKSNNEYILLEKFSSMGNGYTFELESCIFYACAQVATSLSGGNPEKCSVYGDDIICPTVAVPHLYSILSWLGFKVNTEKSFTKGLFRESCGGDYLLGIDVRPFYVKDVITDARLIAFSNQVARSGFPDKGLRKLIESFIKDSNKLYGPDSYGDGHLIGYEFDNSPHRQIDGWVGYLFSTYSKAPKRDTGKPFGMQVLPAYEAYIREMDDSLFDPAATITKNLKGTSVNVQLHRLSFNEYSSAFTRRLKYNSLSYARESDIHVLSGGEQTRLTRVYVLT